MGNDVDRGTREDNGIEFDKTKDLSETNSGADKTDRITYSLGQGEGEKASEATNGKSKSAKSASDSQASNVLATFFEKQSAARKALDDLGEAEYPPYILLDEEDYESLVAPFREPFNPNEDFFGLGPVLSKGPSRPTTPCRQTAVKQLIGRIDELTPAGALQPANFNFQSFRYRHLLGLVEANAVDVKEKEKLLQLISGPSQASSSKWTHPNRIGQAELYDCLEKVLNELRAFTPYSVPFSSKVNRKEVPDYYDVIKRPMDLGTMGRKLKSMLYNNKREFSADLQRIYSNCFTYNTDPGSLLRLHATMLKEKWTRLMAEVPDMEIKTIRSTTENSPSSFTMQEPSQDSSSESVSSSFNSSLSQTRTNSRKGSTGVPLFPDESPAENTPSLDSFGLQFQLDSPPFSMVQVEPRTSYGMGFYHKSRTRPSGRRASKRHPSRFMPEIVCPNQIFPEGIHIVKEKSSKAVDQKAFDDLLLNLKYWRKLWFSMSSDSPPINQEDPEDAVAKSSNHALNFCCPSFDSDVRAHLHKNTKRILALLLANIGFSATKSDALTLLSDTFLSRFVDLAKRLKQFFCDYSSRRVSKISLVKASLDLDDHELTDVRVYASDYISLRRQKLQQAIEDIQEFKVQKALADQDEPEEMAPSVQAEEEEFLEDDGDVDVEDDELLIGGNGLTGTSASGPFPAEYDDGRFPLMLSQGLQQPASQSTLIRPPGQGLTAADLLAVPKRPLFDQSHQQQQPQQQQRQSLSSDHPLKRLKEDLF